MRPIWLLESNVDGLNTAEIQAEVRRQGMMCHIVKHLPAYAAPKDIAGAESLGMDELVIFRGSLNLMRHIHASRRWTPGGWCAVQKLSCSTYYAHFGPFLLNRDHALLPLAEVSDWPTNSSCDTGMKANSFCAQTRFTNDFPVR